MVHRINLKDPSLNVFELGVSKYFLSENILTMRAAHSISLAESQMTKWFPFLLREKCFKENELLRYINSELNTQYPMSYENKKEDVDYYSPKAMRSRESFFRKRSVLRKIKGKTKLTPSIKIIKK